MKIITKILTKSPLLVSESDSRLYDKSQKEFRGKAYIPGSALKGALRETADSFSHVEKYRLMNESLFGKEGTQTGKLFFSNFIAEESNFIIRTHVVISRKLRVSKKGKLFNSRALESGNILNGEIYCPDKITDEEINYLKMLSGIVKKIGGRRSSGYGYIDISFEFTENEKRESMLSKSNYYILNLKPTEHFITVESKSKGYLYKSSDYIKGETIRGAFAKILEKDDSFREIIYGEKVKFPNVYASEESDIPVPIPEVIVKKKYKENKEGIFSSLLPKIVEIELRKKGVEITFEDVLKGNEERLEKASGYYDILSGFVKNPKTETKSFTQTALSRKTRASQKNMLRSYITKFSDNYNGLIRITDLNLVEKITEKTKIYVGNSKTRGFGNFEVFFDECPDLKNLFKKNIESFNAEINKTFNILKIEKDTIFIPVLFISDLILPYGKKPQDFFGMNMFYSNFRKNLTTGWNTGTNNKKPTYEVINKGSLFIFEENKDYNFEKFFNLFNEGVGLKTGSGYGTFVIPDLINVKGDKK